MFCPNCGKENSTEIKFCRACGLNLEKVAELLLEQIPSAQSAELSKRRKKFDAFGSIAFVGFAVVLLLSVGSIIYFILTKMILSGSGAFVGILLIAFIVFALLTLVYVYFNEDLDEKMHKTNSSLNNRFNGHPKAANFLTDKPFEPASSAAENSTELLYPKTETRKLQ